MKICRDCRVSKPLAEFFKTYITKKTMEQRYGALCKECYMDRYSPNRGKPNSGRFKKGQKSWCAGIKMSKEYRKKLSVAHLGQRPSEETLEKMRIARIKKSKIAISRKCLNAKRWRLRVLERDSYTCRECGCIERRKLVAHHIMNFDDNISLRFNLDNGMTLCNKCHNALHGFKKGYGYWTGRKRSQKDIEKMRITKLGVPLTEEHKQKLRDAKKINPTNSGSFKKGQIPWNKGLKMKKI